MTENEKLDLILAEMQSMKTEIQSTKEDVQGMKTEMRGMKTEMQSMKAEIQSTKEDVQSIKSDLREANQRISKLEVGQSEIKKELFKVNRKIADTYNLALDALGMSAENRGWLESGTIKA